MTTPSFSTVPLKPLSPPCLLNIFIFPLWNENWNVSQHEQTTTYSHSVHPIPVATSGHPSLSPVQSWPVALSQHTASVRTRGMGSSSQAGVPEAAGRRGAGGRTGPARDGHTPLAGPWLELLLGAPGSLAPLGVPSALGDVPPPSASQGSAVVGAAGGTVHLQTGKETTVQLIQNRNTLQNTYILYII